MLTAPAAAQEGGLAADRLRPRAPGTPQLPGVELGSPITTDSRPNPAVLVQDDDFSHLGTPGFPRTGLDTLRHIPLGDAPDTFNGPSLRLGLNARYRFEFYDNQNFGRLDGSEDAHLARFNPYAALTVSPRLRVFGSLKHGNVLNSDGPQIPPELEPMDLHMAFVEFGLGDALGLRTQDLLLRVGRQELHYGSGRFLSIRNGPNVRLDFDGALARMRAADGSITDALGFFNVEQNPGSFDNDTDFDTGFWGVYHSRMLREPSGDGLRRRPLLADLYYFGEHDTGPPYATAAGTEDRHTLGLRLWFGGGPTTPGLGGDLELNVQFGSLDADGGAGLTGVLQGADADGRLDIFAWAVVGSVDYTLDAPWSPTLRLRYGYTSGDRDAGDGALNTYRVLVPTGRVFGDLTPIGPGNLMGFQPGLELHPAPGTTVTLGTRHFWRAETTDAIYARSQAPIGTGAGDARYVGTAANVILRRRLGDGLSLGIAAGHFWAGDYFDDNAPNDDISYAAAEVVFRF